MNFRVPERKLDASRFLRSPFFKPPWWHDIARVAIDEDTHWDDVAELLTGSHLALASKGLVSEGGSEPIRGRRH